jgi:hypothetical protein
MVRTMTAHVIEMQTGKYAKALMALCKRMQDWSEQHNIKLAGGHSLRGKTMGKCAAKALFDGPIWYLLGDDVLKWPWLVHNLLGGMALMVP